MNFFATAAVFLFFAFVSVLCWIGATNRLTPEGQRRREATHFMLEYRLWYLEPSSYQNHGLAYGIASIASGFIALLAVAALLF